ENGFYGFRLGRPLLPGDSAELRFDVAQETHGFTNDVVNGPVVGNGTFFNNQEMPRIGYNADGELQDDDTRKWHDLPPRARIPRLDDPAGRMRNDISADADWIAFETTVSTSADQTAVAPGYLQRTWTAGGRRYFRYRMDAPILDFYAYLSGRYAVRRDRWHDVAIEVYYDPGHEFNLDRMVRSVKRSLDYYTEHFGPYQNRQVRILEFPRYAAYAQSYANTIPYSEAIGFIAHVKPGDVDYPFFVTAHEVAHQWWGHQLVGAHVQGSAMLSETLAEYSALMVMEKEYGREKMEDFLRYELDQYLRGRGSETRAEQPLYRVEQQGYIHYNKGGMAMYALRDYIGEDRVNAALAALLHEQRFRGPPYATSRDLLRHLRAVTPDSLRYVLTDLFETVTLYENRTRAATATPLGGGRWMVDMTVEAHKMRADSAGNETEVPMNDLVDVSVVGSAAGMENFPLYFAKQRLRSGVQHVRVTVDGVPARAGVDPRHKLIARRTADNVVNVVRKKALAPPKAARPTPAKPARSSAPRS
ncbi:MAG TPA: M1 family aminopeptidase, partial [Longimicrobiaceae bacterium]|nr:M1 family aminopeptidase [Longimicrobiaceae bacterium]